MRMRKAYKAFFRRTKKKLDFIHILFKIKCDPKIVVIRPLCAITSRFMGFAQYK